MALANKMEKTQSIKVYCRMRPSLTKNEKFIRYEIQKRKEKEILCFKFKKLERFQFQNVFDERTTQSSIFENVAVPILDKFLSGMNGTIFTYGQTGSGKTHTIYGSRQDQGIIPRSYEYLFNKNADIKFTRGNSTLNNKKGESTKTVQFTVNKIGDIDFKNLNTVRVKNASEALELVKSGNLKRRVSSTTMNNQSSRSHSICKITYLNTEKESITTLNLVDLAGSERYIKNMDTDKNTFSEGRDNNVSLMHLHQIINVLASATRPKYIPYRNSTLTLMLKGSLGFRCATALIATIVLNNRSIAESVSTLRYAKDVSGAKNLLVEPERLIRKRSLKSSATKLVNIVNYKHYIT